MRTIFKYPFVDELKLPKGAEILKVDLQRGSFYVWAIVDSKDEMVRRKIVMYGTGHELPENLGKHVGTVFDGPFVWHFFDNGEQ